jgi:hypothetical protein
MQKSQRPIDEAAQETLSWWDKSFVFIKKTQVKTWQAVFITAFVAGAAATLVWTVSNDYRPFSRAAGTSGVPANSCLVVPPGGYFSQATAVNIKCGSNVKKAFYQWDNLGKPKRIGPKGANTKYPARKDMTLKVYGQYKKAPVYGYGYGYGNTNKKFTSVYYFRVKQNITINTPQWSQFGYDGGNSGRSPFIGPKTNKLKWKFQDGKTACNYETVMTSPVLDSKANLYFGTSEGSLIALSPEGKEIWRFTIPDAYSRDNCGSSMYAPRGLYDLNIDYTPAIDNGTIYFGTSGQENAKKIYAVDSNGKLKWTYAIDSALQSDIKLGYNQRIYFTTKTKLYSLDKTGKDIKTYPIKVISNTPAIAKDGTIHVCSGEGLIALDEDLRHKWTYQTKSELKHCDPAINPDTGTIYFPVNGEYKLYAVNPDGTLKWKADIFWAESSPSVSKDETIYIGTADSSKDPESCEPIEKGSGVFFAFNPNGKEKWRYYVPPVKYMKEVGGEDNLIDCYDNTRAIDGPSIIGSDGTIYFGNDARLFIALNPDGKEKWRFQTGDEFDRIGAISSDGTLYIAHAGGGKGGLFAISNEATIGGGSQGETCTVGSETGVKCSSKDKCSSNEWINGCCIAGSCSE